ncbi:10881_t:CDS:1 [Paraglomus occultum]|uniref:10881_t:CDS:1 n=1 Tax=Paraglomus occultum TaxID=144539 RepID=A0A9N9CEE5_9GLOM|nr:10881_t:CDS:1 [Paraglomus occultum]
MATKDTKAKSAVKKVSTKKPAIQKNASLPEAVASQLGIINLEKIICDVVQKELAQLGFLNILLAREKVGRASTSMAKKKDIELDTQPDEDLDLMDIDLVRIKNAKDLMAVKGIVNGSKIQTLLDTCANASFMPKQVQEELDLKIDTSRICRLTGASGERRTLGMVRNCLVNLAPGCVIEEDFAVVDNYPYREIALSRNCLRRYNYDIHESRDHIALTCNEKNYFIPIVPDKNRSKIEEN